MSVGCLFIILVFLWVTRDLFFVPEWRDLFEKGYPTDTTPAILIQYFMKSLIGQKITRTFTLLYLLKHLIWVHTLQLSIAH